MVLGCRNHTQKSTVPLQHHGLARHEYHFSYSSCHLLPPLVLYMMLRLQKCLPCIHQRFAQLCNMSGLCLTANIQPVISKTRSMHSGSHAHAASTMMWLQEQQHGPQPEYANVVCSQKLASSSAYMHAHMKSCLYMCSTPTCSLSMHMKTVNVCTRYPFRQHGQVEKGV